MNNYYLIKYKNENGEKQTFIAKETCFIETKDLCRDLKRELNKRGIEYPIFAIEKIDERQFRYFKMVKGYFALGEE